MEKIIDLREEYTLDWLQSKTFLIVIISTIVIINIVLNTSWNVYLVPFGFVLYRTRSIEQTRSCNGRHFGSSW